MPTVDKVTTAKKILEESRNLFEISPRAETTDDHLKPVVKPRKELQGLPEKLIQKVLAKEANKADTQSEKHRDEIKQLRRLPTIARIIKSIFTSEIRAALPFENVLEKVVQSYPGHLEKDVLEKDLLYTIKITDGWVQNHLIRGMEYLKLDTRDINDVCRNLEKTLRDKETPIARTSAMEDEDRAANSCYFTCQAESQMTSNRMLKDKLSIVRVKELLNNYQPRYGTEVSKTSLKCFSVQLELKIIWDLFLIFLLVDL